MNQLEVQIMGQSYLLGCPEGGEAKLLAAVALVDAAMIRIRDAGKVRARDRIAVLAAVNLAFDLADQGHDARPLAPVLPATDPESNPTSTAIPAEKNQQLRSLLERLDQALADDGRLL